MSTVDVPSGGETGKRPGTMDQIEPDALNDERAQVSRARPLLQGDVFDDVVLPGFGAESTKVQIVAHPCAMRTGANLAPRITVAPVEPHRPVTGKGWAGNTRIMPLAELVEGEHFATKFVDVTACPAELLTRDRRIATLSHQGIYLLQQRLIKHYTLYFAVNVCRRARSGTSGSGRRVASSAARPGSFILSARANVVTLLVISGNLSIPALGSAIVRGRVPHPRLTERGARRRQAHRG